MDPSPTRTQKSSPDPNPEQASLVTQGQSDRRRCFEAMAPARLGSSITEAWRRACWREHHSDTWDAVNLRACAHTHTRDHAGHGMIWPGSAAPHPEISNISFNYKWSTVKPGARDYTAAPIILPSAPETSKDGWQEAATATAGIESSKEACRSRAIHLRRPGNNKSTSQLGQVTCLPRTLLSLGLLPS